MWRWDTARSNINGPLPASVTKVTTTVRQFALQKILTDASSLQSPITHLTQILHMFPERYLFFSHFFLCQCLFSNPSASLSWSIWCYRLHTSLLYAATLLWGTTQWDEDIQRLLPFMRDLIHTIVWLRGSVCVCSSVPWGKTPHLSGNGVRNTKKIGPICHCKYVPNLKTDVRSSDLPTATGHKSLLLDCSIGVQVWVTEKQRQFYSQYSCWLKINVYLWQCEKLF